MALIRLTAGIFIFAICLAGCTSTKTIHPSELHAYGTDIFSHTFYQGSDDKNHYFVYQKGKSFGYWKIPLEEAEIIPQKFPKDSKSRAFVARVQGQKIYLWQIAFECLVFWGTVEKKETVFDEDRINRWRVIFRVVRIIAGQYDSDIIYCRMPIPSMALLKEGISYKVVAEKSGEGYYVDPSQWMRYLSNEN